jgi:FkbM family methyltransferase
VHDGLRKTLRTLQTCFPSLVNEKYRLQRFYRKRLGIAFEKDFDAVRGFPSPPGAQYLDVGANRGQSTDAILARNTTCRVHAFEPNGLLHGWLSGLYGSESRVTIHPFGLGDEEGEFTLFVPFYRGFMFGGLASLSREDAGGWLRHNLLFYRDGWLSIREVTCTIRRLDDLGMDPFFIKLDVQGHELSVLRGAEQTLTASTPILLVESPGEEIRAYLGRLGYERFAYEDGRFIRGADGSLNTFFMTGDKHDLVRGGRDAIADTRPRR